MSARFSKVLRRIWRDEKFQELEPPPPNARDMWLYLLTCDSQGVFPGLYVLRLSTAAEDLGWSRDEVRNQVKRLVEKGMVLYDEKRCVAFLCNAPRHNTERLTANNAKGWRSAWNEMPACEPTRVAWFAAIDALKACAEEAGVGVDALVKSFAAKPPKWLDLDPEASRSDGTERTSLSPRVPVRTETVETRSRRSNGRREPVPTKAAPVRTQETETETETETESESARAHERAGDAETLRAAERELRAARGNLDARETRFTAPAEGDLERPCTLASDSASGACAAPANAAALPERTQLLCKERTAEDAAAPQANGALARELASELGQETFLRSSLEDFAELATRMARKVEMESATLGSLDRSALECLRDAIGYVRERAAGYPSADGPTLLAKVERKFWFSVADSRKRGREDRERKRDDRPSGTYRTAGRGRVQSQEDEQREFIEFEKEEQARIRANYLPDILRAEDALKNIVGPAERAERTREAVKKFVRPSWAGPLPVRSPPVVAAAGAEGDP